MHHLPSVSASPPSMRNMGGQPRTAAGHSYMGLLQGKRAMGASLIPVLSQSERFHAITFVDANIKCDIRNVVPSWITDEESKQAQKRVWDGIAKELERVEPGCVERIL